MTSLHARIGSRKRVVITAAALAATAGLAACSTSSTSAPAPSSSASRAQHSSPPSTATGLHMITNDGHQVAFYVTPGTLPALVLDAGGGNDATYWSKLVPQLSKRTGAEIITYDREGMGQSQDVPGPFSDKEEAADLDTGLKALGLAGRSVLVSHSEAGEIATNLVNDDPGAVDGAVLVDASLPEFYTPAETARVVAANGPAVAAVKKKEHPTQADRQLIAVAADYGPEHLAYHRMTWPSDVPVTVIASASTPFPAGPDADRWRAAQAAFAAAGPNRHLITAAHSSHDVPLDRPTLVVDQVADMWKSVG